MPDPLAAAILGSWRFDGGLICGLLASAWLYGRGWWKLHRELPARYTLERLISFNAGLALIFLALESLLDAFAGFLLEVHMVQHLLLIMFAPPLVWYGQPVTALLRGLPQNWLKEGLGPFLRWRALQRLGRVLSNPVLCWGAMAGAVVFWHLPRMYDLGLASPGWHMLEHASFLTAALLFWRPVIANPGWLTIPYLLLSDIVNTALSAWLVFSSHVVYRTYAAAPRLGGIPALRDQSTAGLLMWIPGSIAYLVPAFVITMRLLGGKRAEVTDAPARELRRPAAKQPLDLTWIVRWRHFRRIPQAILFLLAAAVVMDGLFGPQVAPLNLAGVLPWTYWRGFVVIGLLAAGNLFCMACPFMFVRDAMRKLFPPKHRWPVILRTKWIAAALAALYFVAYEKFRLWNSPWWTAWIVIGYFLVAVAIDTWFQGASFCKYVCPIGQFHFVNSLVSPLEVRTKSAAVCDSCQTHDCIRGNTKQRGCEMQLFQPAKTGNFDCTFCMDCVHACPSDNVAVLRALPPQKAPNRRLDVAALVLVLVFAAFASAAAMTTGTGRLWMYVIGALVAGAALFPNVGLSLVPLGCSMWAAHFFYHLAIGWNSLGPVLARVFHLTIAMSHTMSSPGWLLRTQLLLLDGGLLWALYLAWRRRSAPGIALAIALYLFGVWVFFQPMEMRGMLML